MIKKSSLLNKCFVSETHFTPSNKIELEEGIDGAYELKTLKIIYN